MKITQNERINPEVRNARNPNLAVRRLGWKITFLKGFFVKPRSFAVKASLAGKLFQKWNARYPFLFKMIAGGQILSKVERRLSISIQETTQHPSIISQVPLDPLSFHCKICTAINNRLKTLITNSDM
jgi:hypothetical protein